MAEATILIIDDEPAIRDMVKVALETAGFSALQAANARDGHSIIIDRRPDLVLLDWMLPHTSGLELLRRLRRDELTANTPVIMLTAKAQEDNLVQGLEAGADDYVTKPFNQRELLARVKNILRRIPDARGADAGLKHFAAWVFDPQRRKLTGPDDRSVGLTRAEYELLSALVSHPGEVMSRERLLSQVTHRNWDPNDRTIDVLVRRLRKKVENDPKAPEIILTAHGEGYLFAADVS